MIINHIEKLKDEIIDALISLCSIPSIAPENGGDGEYEKSRYIINLLKKSGVKRIKEINAKDNRVSKSIRPNIIAEIEGKRKDATLWIVTHMDVVPADVKDWTHTKPFKPKVIKNQIYGRGTEDNGQSLIASIYAVKALLNLGLKPTYNVKLLFVSDEETGNKFGIQHVLNKVSIQKNDMFLVPDYGNKEGSEIEIAEKSVVWLKITTEGKQCHASMPDKGKNAFLYGSQFLVKTYELLKNKFDYPDALFDPPLSTFEPTKKETNVLNVNSIPGEDVFYMDCRIIPRYSIGEILDTINKLKKSFEMEKGVDINIKKILEVQGSFTPPKSMIVKALLRTLKDQSNLDIKTIGIGGGTCAAYFRNAGYDAVVWSTINGTEHLPNEHASIKNLINDTKTFTLLMTGNKY